MDICLLGYSSASAKIPKFSTLYKIKPGMLKAKVDKAYHIVHYKYIKVTWHIIFTLSRSGSNFFSLGDPFSIIE